MSYFIIVQMAAISLYTLCASEFLLRYHFDRPVRPTPFTEKSGMKNSGPPTRVMDDGIRLMLVGMAISTVFILIRSVYRTIELLNGWTGPIITNQLYFVRSFYSSFALLTFLCRIFLTEVRSLSRSSPSISSILDSFFVTMLRPWARSISLILLVSLRDSRLGPTGPYYNLVQRLETRLTQSSRSEMDP
jgi:hypothetical protein